MCCKISSGRLSRVVRGRGAATIAARWKRPVAVLPTLARLARDSCCFGGWNVKSDVGAGMASDVDTASVRLSASS